MYNRISIIGGAGTGKTTLSNLLSEKYNIPVTHIDGIHHLKNWQIRDKAERDKIILDIIKKEKWIIDGTYKDTIKQRVEKSDLVIWLDYSTFAQVKGILKRFFKNPGKGVKCPDTFYGKLIGRYKNHCFFTPEIGLKNCHF